MEIIVHRGTHQIGGCITEIKSSKGTRIAIDIGENLPTMDGRKLPEVKVEGLTEGSPNFDAVFITHYHGDHIGLYNKILKDIPIYIGEISKEIFKILQKYLLKAKFVSESDLALIDKFKTYKIPEKILIKDILITPIEVDHSAYILEILEHMDRGGSLL
jgi:ribonuclease J